MGTKEKVAILSASILTIIATAGISPALGVIENHFPGASPLLIKSIVTLPALICIPVSLLTNFIIRYIKKRNLLIIGVTIYLIGGILSYFSSDLYFLLISRGILGIGLGISGPLSFIVISDAFIGKERAKFMGYSSAVSIIGAVVAIPLVGVISSFGWHNIFLIYIVTLIVLLLIIFYLPKTLPYDNTIIKENHIPEKHDENKNIKLNKGVFKYFIFLILMLIIYYSIPTNMALLVKYKALGNTDTAALLITIVTLFSFFSSLFFHRVLSVFKDYLILMSFILMAIGFIMINMANGVLLLGAGTIVIGLGYGLVVPYCMFYSTKCTHKKHTAFVLTMVSVSIYVGEALSPMVLDYMANLFNLNNIIGSFYGAEIIAIIGIIVSLALLLKTKFSKKVVI